MKDRLVAGYARLAGWLDSAAPLLDLGIRLYVADVFFRSGLLKVSNWSGTLYLFENEYHVPLLPPEAAAVLAMTSTPRIALTCARVSTEQASTGGAA